MKRKYALAAVIGAAVLGGLIWEFVGRSKEHASEKDAEKPAPAASSAHDPTGGESSVTLDSESQKRIGLQISTLTATNLSRELKGYGRVLDPAPLAALTTELMTAQVAAIGSNAEFERMKTLHAQNNASARAFQTAEATARRDQLLVQSARDKIIVSWGRVIAEQTNLPAFVRGLTALERALVRIDLPAGESPTALPNGARLESLLADAQSVEAEFLGPWPVVDSQMQGQSFLFLIKTNSVRLAPGAAVTGHFKVPSEAVAGVIVPRSAVIRHRDKAWVYVQTNGAKFVRREIALNHSTAQGWFVSSGLTEKENVVVSGAQTLLSEELKGEIKSGD